MTLNHVYLKDTCFYVPFVSGYTINPSFNVKKTAVLISEKEYNFTDVTLCTLKMSMISC
jgi:hypothetical protein